VATSGAFCFATSDLTDSTPTACDTPKTTTRATETGKIARITIVHNNLKYYVNNFM
jgi:hypothetical protein